MRNTVEGAGGMSDEDGLDSLYESKSQGKSDHDTIDDEEREEMNMTATVPLKVLQGKHPDAPKAGDEIVVKVKEVNGDQALIEYSETPPTDIGEGEGPENADYQSADDELEELGQKGY